MSSIETYLRYAEALGITSTIARPAAGAGTPGAIGSGGTSGTPSSAPSGSAERR